MFAPALADAGEVFVGRPVLFDQTRTIYANRFVQFYGGYGPPGGAILNDGSEIGVYWLPAYRVRTIVTTPVVYSTPVAPTPCRPARMKVRRSWHAVQICENGIW